MNHSQPETNAELNSNLIVFTENTPITNQMSNVIQKWWKQHTSIQSLHTIYTYLTTVLSLDQLQDLSNKCNSINIKCKGDGAGLTGGVLIDMLLCDFLKSTIPRYSDHHTGECDMKICDIPFSLKKINGKSSIALDWSKNEINSSREHFSCDIMVINLKSERWWKKNPLASSTKIKIIYNDIMPSGIYLIDKQFCKHYVKLSSNNKTNTLIESQYLYLMLKRSLSLHLFIELPVPNKAIEFNILKAFSYE